jgi:hypothetical protein
MTQILRTPNPKSAFEGAHLLRRCAPVSRSAHLGKSRGFLRRCAPFSKVRTKNCAPSRTQRGKGVEAEAVVRDFTHQWHPTPLTLAFGLEDWPTPSGEDVRELKRRNGAKFADSEGGCPRLSIISLLHPRTADRREAPALAAVASQINSRTSSREAVVVSSNIVGFSRRKKG